MRTWQTRANTILLALALALGLTLAAQAQETVKVVTLHSSAPLLTVKVMVQGGAADDPEGLEGLASLTAQLLIEGGFGDPAHPVTKDDLAAITRPWGSGAYPEVIAGKETTTFSMTIPRDVLPTYLEQVLQPMFTKPLFRESELERLRADALQHLRAMRLEQIELVGLIALDNFVYDGTSYAHPNEGTDKGLQAVTQQAVERFYATYYTADNIVVGVTSDDPAVDAQIQEALSGAGEVDAPAFFRQPPARPEAVKGRQVLILALPNAISTGLHAGFPLPITREDADYWPLYVANVWLGTHRDSFGHLYEVIREERGYNYGDYSYIEHFADRPFHLFPPANHPRRYQYFSLWLRPVAHEYAYHLLKAMTWELDNFVRTGLTDAQCAAAKNKARVLYLNLAESTDRLLGSALDDDFYGVQPGYLPGYLKHVEAVTCAQVNAAIHRYLQADNLKYVIVTNEENAKKLAAEIAADGPGWGKTPADYHIDAKDEAGGKVYELPEEKLRLLQKDAVWANYWLDIPPQNVHVVPVEKMFVTNALPQ